MVIMQSSGILAMLNVDGNIYIGIKSLLSFSISLYSQVEFLKSKNELEDCILLISLVVYPIWLLMEFSSIWWLQH